MSGAFLFDANRCTGCGACRVACTIENRLAPDVSWRRIETFNPRRYPTAPVFHLSLACNHCATAACMNACPALAFRRDPMTAAVLLDNGRCIGCGYCSWACPYDAPVYDRAAGVMTKCTWCADRLRVALPPACVSHCPTGALGYATAAPVTAAERIEGLPETTLGPSLHVIALAAGRMQPEQIAEPTAIDRMDEPSAPVGIGLRHEWPLAVFTLMMAVLVGIVTAAASGAVKIGGWPFGSAAAAAFAIANLHLGRRQRAWRAILNVRTSWLSREVAFLSAFVVVSVVWLTVAPESRAPGWIAAACGFAGLLCADRLYGVLPGGSGLWHSAGVAVTALLAATAIAGDSRAAALVAGVKLGLYARRKLGGVAGVGPRSIARCVAAVAGVLLLASAYWPALLLMLAGEILDRIEYYEELTRPTPRTEMDRSLDLTLSPAPGTARSGFRAPLKASPAGRP